MKKYKVCSIGHEEREIITIEAESLDVSGGLLKFFIGKEVVAHFLYWAWWKLEGEVIKTKK